MDKVNLFFIPFAGGNKYSYREFQKKAPPFLEIIPLEYPGRGARLREPLVADVNMLTDDLYRQIRHMLPGRKYAIYGHSLGGLIACLLTRKIVTNNDPPPIHLFITGTSGPSADSRGKKKNHLLEKHDFYAEVRRLNGSPEDLLQDDDMMNYFEPILRADFKASETYVYEQGALLEMPITVVTGTEEIMTMDEIHLWQKEASRPVDFRQLPGGHFFIFQYVDTIIKIIVNKIFLD